MARIESSIVVPHTAQKVFAFLSKCENHRRFIPRMTALQQATHGTFAQVGTKLSGMLNYFGIHIPVQYEIIDVQPNHGVAMNGQMGPVQFTDGYVLSQAQNGSRLTFWLELYPTGWTRLFLPFMGWIGKIHAWETLRNLKRVLANEHVASPPANSRPDGN